MRLQPFLDISQSVDLPSFERQLVGFGERFEFEISSSIVVTGDGGDGANVHVLGNIPEVYKKQFSKRADVLRCPVLQRLKKTSVPFGYDQSFYVKEHKADMWEEQAAYGVRTGVAVAMHFPNNSHFALGFDSPKSSLPNDDTGLTEIFAMLQLLAVHAHHAALRLIKPESPEGLYRQLTNRELEILRWTMDGKSAWAVGEILSVSEHTVNFHLRKILRKLDASSKHQAVLKAVSLRLI